MTRSRKSPTMLATVEVLEPRLVCAAGQWLDRRIDHEAPPCPRERCRPPVEVAERDRGPARFANERPDRPFDLALRRGAEHGPSRGGNRDRQPEGEAAPLAVVAVTSRDQREQLSPVTPMNPPLEPQADRPPLGPSSSALSRARTNSSLTNPADDLSVSAAQGIIPFPADSVTATTNRLSAASGNNGLGSAASSALAIERVVTTSESTARTRNDAVAWPIQSRATNEEATNDSPRAFRLAALTSTATKLVDETRTRTTNEPTAKDRQRDSAPRHVAAESENEEMIEFAPRSSASHRADVRSPTTEQSIDDTSRARRAQHANVLFGSSAEQRGPFEATDVVIDPVGVDEGGTVALAIHSEATPRWAKRAEVGPSLADVEIQIESMLEQSQTFDLAGDYLPDGFFDPIGPAVMPAIDAAILDLTSEPAEPISFAGVPQSISLSIAIALIAAQVTAAANRVSRKRADELVIP